VTVAVTLLAAAKTTGCSTGYIKQGGSYYLYATVVGTPTSVTADASAISSSATSVPLTAGSYTVAGSTYNYRTAALTAKATLAEGTLTYGVSINGQPAGTGSLVVDNTAPTGTDVQTANTPGGTAGLPETGDSVTLTYSEPMDPCTIVAGWDGRAPANVVVRLTDQGGQDDALTVWDAANTVQLPLGAVDLGPAVGDYTAGANGAVFGSAGTPSTMTMTGNAVTIQLGTLSFGSVRQPSGPDTMGWSPSGATDRAGNASGGSVNESGPADTEF
jgi:hypothetical protein